MTPSTLLAEDLPADFSPADLAMFRELESARVEAQEPDEDDLEIEEEDDGDLYTEEELEDPDGDPFEERQIEEQLSPPAEDLASLDALWNEAKVHLPKRKRPERDMAQALDRLESHMHMLYVRPEYWQLTKSIILLHADSQTMLGTFDVFEHKRVAGCRKLVRADGPRAVTATESVAGDWWLDPRTRDHIEAAKHWSSQREEMAAVHLDKLGVWTPKAPIRLFLQFGGIMRVELREEWIFASADGSLLLTLPAGVNLYECMDHEGKVALRKQITI